MSKFEGVIRSIIKKSGGSPDKIKLEDFMERMNHCFAFAPQNYWMGVTIMKSPLDLLILQQIIFDKRPTTIIECGTAYGGSAYFMACMMDLMKIDGRVITIDWEDNQTNIYHKKELMSVDGKKVKLDIQEIKKMTHPKIEYIHADCIKADIPKDIQNVMVILDCHHSGAHVLKELEKFSKLVTVGQYIIVEDTDAQGLSGGGPSEAVRMFLKKHKNFVVDKSREKYGISSNIGGYLLKIL